MSSFDSNTSVIARHLYHFHGYLSAPNYRILEYFIRYRNPLTPGEFDNCQTKIREIAYRSIVPVALSVGGTFLYTLNKLGFHHIGKITKIAVLFILSFEAALFLVHVAAYITQSQNYIHVKGNANEISKKEFKIASWNIAGFPSGITYLNPIWKRFDRIVEQIKKRDADIVVLQECLIDGRLPEAFIEKFKDKYAHFFIHNGPHLFGPESGLIVMSKCAVGSYDFEFFKDKSTSQFNINRGFSILKVKSQPSDVNPSFAIIHTHMDCRMDVDDKGYQKDDKSIGSENRKKQLLQIQKKADELKDVNFVVFAGDSNINMKDEKAKKTTAIESILIDPFQVTDNSGQIDKKKGTCTDAFEIMWKGQEKQKKADEWHLDQIALIKRTSPSDYENDPNFKNIALRDRKISPIYFDNTKSNHALSDHQILIATIKGETTEYEIIHKINAGKPLKKLTFEKFLKLAKERGREITHFNLFSETLTNDQLKQVIDYCPNLQDLILKSKKIDMQGFSCLSQLSELKRLDLRSCIISDSDVQSLVSSIPSLLWIDDPSGNQLKFIDKLTDDEMIKKINEGLPVNELTFDKFLKLAKKRGVEITSLTLLSEVMTNEQLKQVVNYCPHLEALVLKSKKIDMQGFSYLSNLTKLKWLNLKSCEISDRDIDILINSIPSLLWIDDPSGKQPKGLSFDLPRYQILQKN